MPDLPYGMRDFQVAYHWAVVLACPDPMAHALAWERHCRDNPLNLHDVTAEWSRLWAVVTNFGADLGSPGA